jgi:chromosome segregation ATPase
MTIAPTFAQMTKAEKKELQKQLKELQKNPKKYKELKQILEDRRANVKKMEGELAEITSSIADIQKQIKEKDERIKELGDELARLQTENKDTQKIVKKETNSEGIIYKVQVPIDEASLYEEISEIDGKKRPVFSGEEDQDGKKKYTFGYFKNKKEAETFSKYLQMLRIKDAKVFTYKDGVKVD